MSFEAMLYTRLTGFAGLAALVGTRIYPNLLPQNVVYPALSYREVSDLPPHAMGSDCGIQRVRLQVDLWAETYVSLRATVRQVAGTAGTAGALQRWRGVSGADEVLSTLQDGKIETYEDAAELHRAILDFIVSYREG